MAWTVGSADNRAAISWVVRPPSPSAADSSPVAAVVCGRVFWSVIRLQSSTPAARGQSGQPFGPS
eukprot:15390917-Heterocapsa_arctica.AAC.1